MGANLPVLFAVSALSLASGYYIGQSIPREAVPNKKKESQKKLKEVIQKAKKDAKDKESDEEYEEESEEEDYEIESTALNDVPGEVRMALVIRQDLGMQKGKIAAQCCHAALGCYRLIATNPSRASYNPTMVNRWLRGGQAKITLKCPDKDVMDELYAKAIAMGVNANVIHDAGRTQIAAGSATVLGLGPAPKAVLDQITGELKLY
ncbi:peptidyl-tRNA hydrolase 2 [Monosporozyma unispora]|nr:Gluconate transport-inducing protein [Kazachstania unispora]